jgi:hypothetical protein
MSFIQSINEEEERQFDEQIEQKKISRAKAKRLLQKFDFSKLFT